MEYNCIQIVTCFSETPKWTPSTLQSVCWSIEIVRFGIE